MSDDKLILLRAHTEILRCPKGRRRRKAATTASTNVSRNRKEPGEPRWPESALVIDCETSTDERQSLTFGFYRYCRADANGMYVCVAEGIFHADELRETDREAMSILEHYVDTVEAQTPKDYRHRLRLLSRSEFMRQVFWRATLNPQNGASALIVGFNLPFDLSRLAVECSKARPHSEGWSLVMPQDEDPKTGLLRSDPFRQRVKTKPIDSKAAFIRFAGVSMPSRKTGRRLIPYTRGRFLDLRMLGWALRNQSYSLESACQAFGVPGKLNHEPTGQITMEEIDYCRQDVRATLDLLNAMRTEFDRHPIDLRPDKAYSPASIAKAYLKEMGVVPPRQKFALAPKEMGVAMQSYYRGRAECRIRQTSVPVVHTDFLSEYPTVDSLMGLWSFLMAESLRVEDATDEVKRLLANLKLDTTFDQDFWKSLSFLALVHPAGNILPVCTAYNGKTSNIGINPLTSNEPIWYAGPDLVAAALLTDRPPQIIRAIRVVPEGKQAGLNVVNLRGMVEIDPLTDDFFKVLIEARARVKANQNFAEEERNALSYFLKILANAGSYGLLLR